MKQRLAGLAVLVLLSTLAARAAEPAKPVKDMSCDELLQAARSNEIEQALLDKRCATPGPTAKPPTRRNGPLDPQPATQKKIEPVDAKVKAVQCANLDAQIAQVKGSDDFSKARRASMLKQRRSLGCPETSRRATAPGRRPN